MEAMETFSKDTIDMVKTQVTYTELGSAAQGTIEVKPTQQERIEEFTERVGAGEFHVAIEGRLPCGCIDGRGGSLRANSAGGTESLMVADDLTTQQFRANDGTTHGAYANILRFLKKNQYDVGGHDADHKPECGSGCGANDKLEDIYRIIAKNGDTIRTVAASIGVDVDVATHEMIVDKAGSRTTFSDGETLLAELEYQAGQDAIDNLAGPHNEAVAVINTRFGTTLDRDALAEEFGPDYQAFNVDVWSFDEAAKVISLSEAEQAQKVAALAYYNIATALALCGPSMRIVVL